MLLHDDNLTDAEVLRQDTCEKTTHSWSIGVKDEPIDSLDLNQDDHIEFTMQKRHRIMNTYVSSLTLEETVHQVEQIIEIGKPTQHVVINASKINLMRNDSNLTAIINECPIINADGASIIWAAKLLGVPVSERVTGIDLFLRLVEIAADKNYKVFLFGAKKEVVAKVEQIFEMQYPTLKIVGKCDGYFDEEDEPTIVADMAASGADMMFVAFSSPQKEFWVNKYLTQLGIPFVMGVGGSFDIIAGITERAPKCFQEHGLEWLYRFIQEPKRLWKRYIIGNIKFICYVLSYKFGWRGRGID